MNFPELLLDYCAIVIFTITFLSILVRRATKGVVNKLFLAVLSVSTLTAVFDIASVLAESVYIKGNTDYYALLYVFNLFYLFLRNGTAFSFVFFIYAITRTTYKIRSIKSRFLLGIPFWILVTLLVTNALHGWVYTIDPVNGYRHGPVFFLFYVVSSAYMIYGAAYLIKFRKFIAADKFITLIAIYLIQVIAVLMQAFIHGIYFEMFAMALDCLLMVLIVVRPEELIDLSVGLLSWKAYRNEIKKITYSGHPVQIVVLKIVNAVQMRAFIGEHRYNEYIFNLASAIDKFSAKNNFHVEIYYEAPGYLYVIFDEKYSDYDVYSMLPLAFNTIREKLHSASELGLEVECKMLVIHYPEVAVGEEDLIKLGHNFTSIMPFYQDYVKAEDLIVTQRYELENNMDNILSDAIKNGKFKMYYQPIYSVKEKKFSSAEALIRLKDEKYGMISPGIFIPAAESSGSIIAIGDFVIESVFKFVSESNIKALGLEYIEINLSMAQCTRKDFPARVKQLQDRYKIDPKQINFEIVETADNSVDDAADKNIRELVELGYSFSLDDYGTGYSNIKRISVLPLSIIKIDKSLVDNIGTPDGKSIIRNTVRMMKDINKELVVEGVEVEEVAEELSQMDCDYIQGFYYSKPLPK